MGNSNNDISSVEKYTPKIARHIHTTFLEFDFATYEMGIGETVKSSAISVPGINGDAFFVLGRTSKEVLSVSCSILSETKGDGYIFRLYFHAMDVMVETKSAEMRFPETCVTVDYEASYFKNSLTDENQVHCIKCVLRSIETSYLSQERRVSLDRQFQGAIQKFSKFDGLLKDMSYILGRNSLDYIFTGRETEEETLEKTVYIKRAFDFVKALVGYFRARNTPGLPVPKIPIGEILGHIYLEEKQITAVDCLCLFLRANCLGLIFLKILCTEYILANLNNSVVLGALIVADTVEDEFLFRAASDFFLKNEKEIIHTRTWKKMEDERRVYIRSFVYRILHPDLSRSFINVPMLEDERNGEE